MYPVHSRQNNSPSKIPISEFLGSLSSYIAKSIKVDNETKAANELALNEEGYPALSHCDKCRRVFRVERGGREIRERCDCRQIERCRWLASKGREESERPSL